MSETAAEQSKDQFEVINALGTIGNTPLVLLEKLFPQVGINVYAKLEFFNPSGSIKDHIVSHIIGEAERTGELRKGGTIVENTSGNTGAAIGMIAALKGYQAIFTMPDKVSQEKQDALRAYGAKLVICPTDASPDSEEHYVSKARSIAAETKNSFMINQYDNQKNADAHYQTTGPEIWRQTNGQVDYFVASGSTGGTVTGTGRYLKDQDPSVKIVMPDPIGSIYYSYFKTGTFVQSDIAAYAVEGIGEDHIAKCMDFSIVDEMIQFNDDDAFSMCKKTGED